MSQSVRGRSRALAVVAADLDARDRQTDRHLGAAAKRSTQCLLVHQNGVSHADQYLSGHISFAVQTHKCQNNARCGARTRVQRSREEGCNRANTNKVGHKGSRAVLNAHGTQTTGALLALRKCSGQRCAKATSSSRLGPTARAAKLRLKSEALNRNRARFITACLCVGVGGSAAYPRSQARLRHATPANSVRRSGSPAPSAPRWQT